MPSILFTNANHILNKIDELSILSYFIRPAIIAVTETWLTGDIVDDHLLISHSNLNYKIYRRDRPERTGGGVLLYIRDDIKSWRLDDLESNNHEVLWVALRPTILPRPFGITVICVIYCPPWYSLALKTNLIDYLTASCDKLTRTCPNTAFIFCGDFNSLSTDFFVNRFNFRQVSSAGTRGTNVLDKVFLNCSKFYFSSVDILPPLGRSDHNCVYLKSLHKVDFPAVGWRSIFNRRINDYTINSFGSKLISVDWRPLFYSGDVQFQSDYFYANVNAILDEVMPLTEYRIKNNDKPWVTAYFRHVICMRNKAFQNGDPLLYKRLRNKVNHLRRNLKKEFYFSMISNFNSTNPSRWWKTIKVISGLPSNNFSNNSDAFKNLHHNGDSIDPANLPEIINTVFSSFSDEIPGFDSSLLDTISAHLGPVPDKYVVNEYSVYRALCNLKAHKAVGPDGIPNTILKALAELFSAPLCCIINTSIRTGVVPCQWKISRISPLPKLSPPTNIINHLRPISITSSLSKIAESFMCRFFNDHFTPYRDPNQYGCTKGLSTTLALISFTHYLFESLDNSNCFARILFVDFTKSFDLINHNILYHKMLDINLPPHLCVWFLSFLINRLQYVSINNISSGYKLISAGTPQGTLSGPIDFNLLINDLRFTLEYLKYVDDTTVISISDDPLDNSLQQAADDLTIWCCENGMEINNTKTKEMLIYFGKKYPHNAVPNLFINNSTIERVSCFKLLGVYYNNVLTWSNHVSYIVSKACKRIYCITQLVRAGINCNDVVTVYCSIIRSVLEYCCQVWHPGLTSQQSKELESVQKRCLKIIYPDLSYNTALQITGLERLSERRERMVKELFGHIKNMDAFSYLIKDFPTIKNTRNAYSLSIPKTKTYRARHDFITYCLYKKY